MIDKFLNLLNSENINIATLSAQEVDVLAHKYSAMKYMFYSLYHYITNPEFKYQDYFESWNEAYARAVKLRKLLKANRPKFTRYLAKRFKRLNADTWRKPKGLHNKKRKKIKCKGATPKIGYGVPSLVRYANAKGYFETLCFNIKDIEQLKSMHMIRISSKVGLKKKLYMEYVARTQKKYIINPICWKKYEFKFQKVSEKI